jgi:hypothetical protein
MVAGLAEDRAMAARRPDLEATFFLAAVSV